MRSLFLIFTLVAICLMGARDVHACKTIPKEIEIDEKYTVYTSRLTSFNIQLIKIDTDNCWIIGELLKKNKNIFIDINEIIVISEEIRKR